MQIAMFCLGFALVIISIIALFKKFSSGQFTIKLPFFEMSGVGAPAIFLIVGLVLIFSGRGWSQSIGQVGQLTQTVAKTEAEKSEMTDAAAGLYSALNRQREVNQSLIKSIPGQTLSQLQLKQPRLLSQEPLNLPPKIEEVLRKRAIR